jgi:2',3'-cyclic-nucleotide 2'-phosphodiesterase (5'-nucleotidase family)
MGDERMNRIVSVAIVAAAAGTLCTAGFGGVSAQDTGAALCLTILHNNDAESQLLDAGSDLEAFGGAAEFVNVVRREHEDAGEHGCGGLAEPEVPRAVVILSSGDNFLAGPEFKASLEKGPPFYDSMVVNAIGYDALAIGNHEFDFGPDVLADFIDGVDDDIPFLSANLDLTGEPRLQELVGAGRIRSSIVIERGGFKIGVIGATTPQLRSISSPRNVTVREVAPAVGIEIDRLKAAGVRIIILISHLQSVNEDIDLLATLSGVDIAIAGGGDELLANHDTMLIPGDEENVSATYPHLAADVDGKDVPVITTSGSYRYLGRLEVAFDASGEVLAATGDPIRVVRHGADDASAADPEIEERVTKQVEAALQELAASVVGESEVPLDGRRESVRTRETNLGNLITDSLLAAAQRSGGDFGAGEVDIAIQNGGGIRNDSVLPAAPVTELDTFDVLPFPNFVTVIEGVNPERLKLIMENAVSALEDRGGRFAQIAGFTMAYDPAGAAQVSDEDGKVTASGDRVRSITLDDGTPIVAEGEVVDGAPAVGLATIDFLARGGDQYPLGGDLDFTPLGVSYQQALSRYISEDLDGTITAEDYPEGGSGRITTTE